MKLLLAFLTLAVPALGHGDDSIDGFAGLWYSSWRNITVPRDLPVSGSMPTWLRGSLVKNAGGAFETKERNVTFAFDGIPKIFKFHVADGKVAYQERFLGTGYFNYIESHHDIPKTALMGPTDPPLAKLEAPNAAAGDIDNIQVWRLKGDDKILAVTDSPMVDSFDLDTLESTGQLPLKDEVKEGLVQLSCAHPHYEPGSDQTRLLNFASSLFKVPDTVLGHHELIVFRMGIDKVRHGFGSVVISYAPYIHSFAVTKTKMILVVYPLSFKVSCVMEFSPLIECMTCPRDRNATVYVFDLASTTKDTKPVATIEAPYHMVMHHVNAYDLENGDAVFDVSAQDSCDTLFAGPTGQHANLVAMKDQGARDQVQHWGTLRTFQLSFNNGGKDTLSFKDTLLRDAAGYVYHMDFPFVNPNVAAQPYRYLWGLSSYAQNSTHYEDWALLKIDRKATGVNTLVWFKKGHYPGEPVFVPKPGATTEDEGVVLTTVQDGQQNRGYLLVLDAVTMTELATSTLNPGEHLPYSQHGRWFDQDQVTATMV